MGAGNRSVPAKDNLRNYKLLIESKYHLKIQR